MRLTTLRRMAALWVGLAAFATASTAGAQSPEASEIAQCLCLNRDVNALSAELTGRQQAYQAVRDQLAQLDSQLQQERAGMDVNNPQSVARFRELLERRDRLFRRSTGPEFTGYSQATERYNARVNDYNARCANRPRDPDLLARVQATLSCPPTR